MNDAYTRGFIDKCAQVGVDPEALVKAAEEVEPEALVEAVKNVKATDKPLLDSAVYDYLAQFLPGIGPSIVGAARAGGRDESVIGGAAKGLAGSLVGSAAGGVGGGIAGGAVGGGLAQLIRKLQDSKIAALIKKLKAEAAKTTDFERFDLLRRKIDKLNELKGGSAALPVVGLAGLGILGANLGGLMGGAHGLRYMTRKPKKSKKNSDE